MSNDKIWEQLSQGMSGAKPAESGSPAQSGDASGGIDADVLAAWLKALPPNDPLVPTPTPPTPTPPSDPTAWPPAAPVDPFAGISAGSSTASDWDLALDLDPISSSPALPPAAPAAPPIPAVAPPAPSTGGFDFDLGGLAGPIPAANPFAPGAPIGNPPAASPVAPAPAPAVPSPFGPPPPPPAPPAEALEAPPLRLQVTSGRRTQDLVIQGEALIGRPDATRGLHPEIDLRLDDAVSRRHAKIFVRNGVYVLTDLNSTNGTRHNSTWLQPEVEIPLKSGDEIEVGEVTRIRVIEAP